MGQADCTKALELDPNNPKAFNRRGQARQRLGDLKGAIKDFEQAQKNHPDQSITDNLKRCKQLLKEKGASREEELKAEEERKVCGTLSLPPSPSPPPLHTHTLPPHADAPDREMTVARVLAVCYHLPASFLGGITSPAQTSPRSEWP